MLSCSTCCREWALAVDWTRWSAYYVHQAGRCCAVMVAAFCIVLTWLTCISGSQGEDDEDCSKCSPALVHSVMDSASYIESSAEVLHLVLSLQSCVCVPSCYPGININAELIGYGFLLMLICIESHLTFVLLVGLHWEQLKWMSSYLCHRAVLSRTNKWGLSKVFLVFFYITEKVSCELLQLFAQ